MDTVSVQPTKKKQVINLVSHRSTTINSIEDKTCLQYLRALGYEIDEKTKSVLSCPRTHRTNVSVSASGKVVAYVNDKEEHGYKAICHLICGTLKGGSNAVKLGALVLDGLYPLSVFESLEEYRPELRNKTYRVMKVIQSIGQQPSNAKDLEFVASIPETGQTRIQEKSEAHLSPFTASRFGKNTLEKNSKQWVVAAVNDPIPKNLDLRDLATILPNCTLAVEIMAGRKLLEVRKITPDDREFSKLRAELLPNWSPRRCRKAQAIARFFEKFKAGRGAGLCEKEIFQIQKHALERLGGYAGQHENHLQEVVLKKLRDGKRVTAKLVNEIIAALEQPRQVFTPPHVEEFSDLLLLQDRYLESKVKDVWDEFEFTLACLRSDRPSPEDQRIFLRFFKHVATTLT